ncbi:MAG: DUF11 domain-containing protein [Sphingomonadales bacterium]|nr:DUF11 domain-containing protein [Sphingomonadales bacterium]
MTSKLRTLVASTALAAVIGVSSPAFAVGTNQGTDITNSVTVNYQVGSVAQTPVTSNTDMFEVDRKVAFTVVERTTIGTTSVNPGQTVQQTAFTLTNLSNDILDFDLTAANLTTGTATPRGTDAFAVTSLLICLDADNNNVCDAAATATLSVNDLSATTGSNSINVLVLGNVPLTATNGQISGVRLTATARFSNGTAFVLAGPGQNISTDANANVANAVDTVLADSGRDGVESALDDYTVQAATLSVWKSSRVVSDLVSASNPKALPGATVEYCISVQNSGGAAATNVAIEDILPANTTYVASSILLNGTVTGHGTAAQACSAGTAGGSFTATPSPRVSGTLASVAGGGGVSALIFRVTID